MMMQVGYALLSKPLTEFTVSHAHAREVRCLDLVWRVALCCTLSTKELLLIELATVANWTATGTRTASLTLVVLEPVKRPHRHVSAMASLAWWQALAAFEHDNQLGFVISNECSKRWSNKL